MNNLVSADQLASDLRELKTHKAVADKYGVSVSVIGHRIKRLRSEGYEFTKGRRLKLPVCNEQFLDKCRELDFDARALGKHYGCTRSYVLIRLAKLRETGYELPKKKTGPPLKLPPLEQLLVDLEELGSQQAVADKYDVVMGTLTKALIEVDDSGNVVNDYRVNSLRVLPDIDQVMQDLEELGSQAAVAKKYGVRQTAVSRVIVRHRNKHPELFRILPKVGHELYEKCKELGFVVVDIAEYYKCSPAKVYHWQAEFSDMGYDFPKLGRSKGPALPDDETLISDYNQLGSVAAVARKYNDNYERMYRKFARIKQAGGKLPHLMIKRSGRKLPSDEQLLIDLQSMSQTEIADKYDVSTSLVSQTISNISKE